MRSNKDILDGVSNDPGMVGLMAKQSAELGATITQVTTGDAAGNDEALIVLIVGRESIAGAKRALDEWENGRPAPKRRTRAKREGGKRG